MVDEPRIDFGDRVRIVRTEETEQRGFADAIGQVMGFTTPSLTGINDVIGGSDMDVAVAVEFESPELGDAWFTPSLVEFVDHAPGTEISIGEKRLRRTSDGGWEPSPGRSS